MTRDEIEARLTAVFRDGLGCIAVTLTKEQWLLFPFPAKYRYGWVPPIPVSTDPELYVGLFSPELLEEITAWIEDEAVVDQYFNLVELLAAVSAANDGDEDATNREVESFLYSADPDGEDRSAHLQLLNEVEMRALEGGIVLRD